MQKKTNIRPQSLVRPPAISSYISLTIFTEVSPQSTSQCQGLLLIVSHTNGKKISFLVFGIFLSHNKTQSHSSTTIDFAVKLSASEDGKKKPNHRAHQSSSAAKMTFTPRKCIILIMTLKQQIHRKTRTTLLFHVLSQFKFSHQKTL